MATVIDSLLIELGLDASKFNEAQKKSVEELRKFGQENTKQNKEAQRQAKDLGEAYTKVRNSIIGIGAAIVGVNGFKDFVNQMVTGNAALGRTSVLLGMNVRDLDAWGAAAKTVGGTAEGFQASMQNLVGGLQKFKMGMGGEEVVTALARLGVQAKNGSVDLYELADALKRVRDQQGVQAAMSLAQQLGLDQGTFQLMLKSNDALKTLVEQMRQASGASRENSREAQLLQKMWGELAQTGNALAQNVFTNLTPAMEGVLGLTKFAIDNFKRLDDRVGGAASTFIAVAGAIKTARIAIEKLAELFGVSSGGWLSTFFTFLNRASVGAQLLFHSEGLNKGEQEALNQKWGGAGGGAVGGTLPRNMRNHNPGNIEYGDFAKAHGATGSDGRFAVFPDDATGNAAMQALLEKKRSGGLDTISKLIGGSGDTKGWLGSGADAKAAPSYIADVSRRTGLGADQHLSASQMASVQSAMAAHEGWIGARATAPQGAAGGGSKVETNIGTITVNSQATDANGVARDMHTALANNALITAGMVGAN